MSRSEKYLPFIIAVVGPAIGLINANLPYEDIAINRLLANYLQISVILLIIWYFNRWLIMKTTHAQSNTYPYRYLIIIGANIGLIATMSLVNAVSLSERLMTDLPTWLLVFRLSIVILIFNVILRVFQAQREKNKLEVQNLSLQAENLKFQIDTLKQQINPHFLFNSLNTLLDLVEEDKEKAIQYIRSFSKIYRSVLQSAKYDFIALEDELKFLSEYWSLLKVRFHDAIDLSIDINANKMSSLIPPLSLQFLVENAVKNNEALSKNPLRIEISESENRLIVRNKINLKSSVESEKLGLQNLQQRFTLLHKPIEYKNEDGHFMVSIPLKTDA